MLNSSGGECELGSRESQCCQGSRGRGVCLLPRREVGQFELLQLFQELLEADEKITLSSSKCCKISDGENVFQVTVRRESVNFLYCQRSKVRGSIRQESSGL